MAADVGGSSRQTASGLDDQRHHRVGYQADPTELRQAKQNLCSVREHPEEVTKYIESEREAGRVVAVGRVEQAEALGVHCSPFGVIPPKDKAGKWRLIVDLSSPAGTGSARSYPACRTCQ